MYGRGMSEIYPSFYVDSDHPHYGGIYVRNDLPSLYNHFKIATPTNPPDEALSCKVPLDGGVEVSALLYDNKIFVGSTIPSMWHAFGKHLEVEEVEEPFIQVKLAKPHAYKKPLKYKKRQGWGRTTTIEVDGFDHDRYGYGDEDPERVAPYLDLEISVNGSNEVVPCRFSRPAAGRVNLVSEEARLEFVYSFYGLDLQTEVRTLIDDPDFKRYGGRSGWGTLREFYEGTYKITVDGEECEEPLRYIWHAYITRRGLALPIDDRGIKAMEKRKDIAANLDRLKQEDPKTHLFYLWLHDGRIKDKTSNNRLIAAFLTLCGDDYDKLRSGLLNAMEKPAKGLPYYDTHDDRGARPFCLTLPGAQAKREEEKAKTEWQFQKSNKAKAITLGIDPQRHKQLLTAVEKGDIPLGVFHVPGNHQHLINVEFDLIERSLKRGWGEVISTIAKNASRRTTYEKNFTPYLAFLFRIERYLKRHTKKKWTAIPKHVESTSELEMTEAEGETVKTRSALTPIADNEANTVTVPYASLATYGRVTTYCYSFKYCVFEEDHLDILSEAPIQHELERGLNGRDDYGLMYYTLTGSPPASGYPTFLIIFERLARGTRVHFHRVHPNRSKQGVPTPPCRLIEECYRYMAGNIRAEEVYAQQGDLIFIKQEQDELKPQKGVSDEGKPVAEFESHKFIPLKDGPPVVLYERQVKSIKNRMGFLYSKTGFKVDHPEHDPLKHMPPGLYEVRRCRSWEANPKAIWSMMID